MVINNTEHGSTYRFGLNNVVPTTIAPSTAHSYVITDKLSGSQDYVIIFTGHDCLKATETITKKKKQKFYSNSKVLYCQPASVLYNIDQKTAVD